MSPGPGVPSPCVNVCLMDERSGCCLGCHRTLDEIARWSTMADDDKRAVWACLAERRAAAGAPVPNPGAPR